MFSSNPTIIYTFNVSCLLCQILLVVIESLQFKYYGFASYLQDTWNYFDISHMVIYTGYFIARVAFGNTGFLLPINKVDIVSITDEAA